MMQCLRGKQAAWRAAIWVGLVLVPAALCAQDAGFRGLLAVRGTRVLAAENPDRAFTPASVQKLVVSAASLHHLGPDYRFVTRLRSAGAREGDVLQGDLVVDAGGDPTWSERFHEKDARLPLRDLARALRKRGIARVDGNLVIDLSRFPGRAMPVDWPVGDVAFSYGAPVSGLAVDENHVWLHMAPGGYVGAPGRVRSGSDDLEVVNQTRTVSKARHGRGTVDFQPVWGEARVIARGEYPISEGPFDLKVASPDPVARAGRELQKVLAEEGVEVTGEVGISRDPLPQSAVLATVTSPPLSEILVPVLEDSNNWLAEMVLRLVALEVAGEGRLDTGIELLEAFLEETVGAEPESYVLDDASGLSPFNLITPNTVLRLLQFAWQQPWRDAFVQALPSSSRGTLARGWPRLPAIAAKTGTLRGTQTLAGILDPRSSEPTFFVVFLNHRREGRFALRAQIAEQLWNWHRTRPASGSD